MIRSRVLLTSSSFVSMFFLGVLITIVGAAAKNIGLEPYQIGLLITSQNLGFIISVAVSGIMADIYEKPRILLAGSALLSLSLFAFYATPLFGLNLIIMFFIGVGIGCFEGVADAMLLDLHERRESLIVNINHFFVTLGSLAIAAYLIVLQMNWQRSLIQSGIVVAVLAIVFLLSRLESRNVAGGGLIDKLRVLRGQKALLLLFVATVCTLGLSLSSLGIMTTFLMDMRGFDQITSKLGLVVFLAAVGVGRLIVGFTGRRHQLYPLTLLLFALSTIFTATLFFIDLGPTATYVLILLAGMAVSALLPLLIALASILYKDMAGTVLGIMKIGIPLGGIVFPLLLSLTARYASFKLSLMLFPAFALIGFLVMLSGRREISEGLSRAV